MQRSFQFILKGEKPGEVYIRDVNPDKPGRGLQPEEIISVYYPYSDALICSDTPARITVEIDTDSEHFEEEKKKLEHALRQQAKPIKEEELEESQKRIALLTMLGYVNKEIAAIVKKSTDAVRKCKERIYDKYGVSDHVMLARYFLKRILRMK